MIDLQVVGKDAKVWFVRGRSYNGVKGHYKADTELRELDQAQKAVFIIMNRITDLEREMMSYSTPAAKNLCAGKIELLHGILREAMKE
jgi:hypothetical protein